MEENHYLRKMQKVLLIAKELHQRGYENLRVIPSKSPSGMSWRCSFVISFDENQDRLIPSNWIQQTLKSQEVAVPSIADLTDLFIKENSKFIKKCKGKNPQYAEWFRQMLLNLEDGELPYAFSDYFGPTDHWQTSAGQKIYTLPNEELYYF